MNKKSVPTSITELKRIGRRAVEIAQEEARAAGVPCVYSINGVLHWELPNGELTTEDPWEGRNEPPSSEELDQLA